DEPVILFMSRLHPVKGLDYLIPALSQLSHIPFTFVLAGSGEPKYEQIIEDLIASAGLQTRTIKLGFVSGELKALLLQGSDLVALTSHSENFGVVVLEALAVGTPALVTLSVPLASMIAESKFGYVCELNTSMIAA